MEKELPIAIIVFLILAAISFYPIAETPTGFAVLTKSAYVSGSFVSKLTLNFDKEYTGVQSIAVEAKPGGEGCKAVVEATAYDANGNAVATLKTPNTATHKTGTATKAVDGVKVKKVTAKVTGSWPACGYLDNLKATLTYVKPVITYSFTAPKVSTRYYSDQNVVSGTHSATITVSSKDGSALTTFNIKLDGTTVKSCSNAATCTYDFKEPASNIGKTRTYTVEAIDKDGDKTSFSGSYKVYGITDKSSTAYGTYDTTIDMGREYTAIGIDVRAEVKGTDSNCRISPKVTIYDSGGKQTGSFDLGSVLLKSGTTTGWKAFPQTIRAAKIRIYVDKPETGCYRYVSTSTATVQYSAPPVS